MKRLKHLWKLFWSSVNGIPSEILTGNLNRSIILLAIPMILEMSMESLFAVVDIAFVSKIGINAVAVVGLTESLLTIVYSLAWGFAMGATAMVARRVGEKDSKGAAIAGAQAIYTGVGFSLLISAVGLLYSEELLILLGASREVVHEGTGYMRIMLGGNAVIMLLFLINGIFRGAGDAALAMRSLWLANGINIILDPLLIFGIGPFPELGVEGAAISTTIGRASGVVYQLYHLYTGAGIIKIHGESWRVRKDIIVKIISVSAGGAGQFIIASASWIFLMRIISHFGSVALAGYTIAIRIIIFTLLPAWGMANAAATMVGQNLGANQPDRAEKAVWRAGLFNMIFMAAVMIVFQIFAEQFVRFFSKEEDVVEYAKNCLNILSLGYLFFAYGMVIVQSFNGSGDTRTPTALNFFVFWMIQIPLAYTLAIKLAIGTSGVFWSIVICESILTVTGYLLFRRGKWKKYKI